MKVVKLATSAKLRAHLAGKRPSLDFGRKGRRWRVSMSTRVWRVLLTVTALLLILGAAVQLPQFSHYVEKVTCRCFVHCHVHLVLFIMCSSALLYCDMRFEVESQYLSF